MTVTSVCESLAPTPAFIEAIRDNKLVQRFAKHPSTIATYTALRATQSGFGLIYRMERDQQYGRELAAFIYDIARLVFWPLLALALTGMATGVRYLCSQQFRNLFTDAYLWLLVRFERQSNFDQASKMLDDNSADEREVI